MKEQQALLSQCQNHHGATFGEPLFAETISARDMGQDASSGRELTEAQLNTIGYVASRYGVLAEDDDTPMPDPEAIAEWLAQATQPPQGGTPDTVESLRARLSGSR